MALPPRGITRVAVVQGSSRGIGLALVEALLARPDVGSLPLLDNPQRARD